MKDIKEKICVSNLQIRTGIDLVASSDMEDIVNEPVGVLLTENEWINMANFPDRLQRLAGKFAGKEAIMKVLGYGIESIELVDIEILHDTFGKPIVFLQGSALSYWRQSGLTQLEISISHHKDYAVGIAVAL